MQPMLFSSISVIFGETHHVLLVEVVLVLFREGILIRRLLLHFEAESVVVADSHLGQEGERVVQVALQLVQVIRD